MVILSPVIPWRNDRTTSHWAGLKSAVQAFLVEVEMTEGSLEANGEGDLIYIYIINNYYIVIYNYLYTNKHITYVYVFYIYIYIYVQK